MSETLHVAELGLSFAIGQRNKLIPDIWWRLVELIYSSEQTTVLQAEAVFPLKTAFFSMDTP